MDSYLKIKNTERLILRPLTKADKEIWSEFLSHEIVSKYYPPIFDVSPETGAENWIARQLNRYKNNEFGMLALIDKSTQKFVGQAGLLKQKIDGEDFIEIGYHLFPEYWGKGYATEAAVFLKDLAFNHYNINKVISIIHIDNIPSQKVAIRNNMVRNTKTTYGGIPVFIYQ